MIFITHINVCIFNLTFIYLKRNILRHMKCFMSLSTYIFFKILTSAYFKLLFRYNSNIDKIYYLKCIKHIFELRKHRYLVTPSRKFAKFSR